MVAVPGTAETFRASMALLRTRRFGTFWVASLLSNIGTWAQQVAQPWLMLSLSGSSFLVGLDAFAMDAPAWGLTLVGGVLADRGDRRKIIFGFQALQKFLETTPDGENVFTRFPFFEYLLRATICQSP